MQHVRTNDCHYVTCVTIYGDDVFVLYIMRAHRDIEEISSFVVKLILLSYMLAVLIPFYVSWCCYSIIDLNLLYGNCI